MVRRECGYRALVCTQYTYKSASVRYLMRPRTLRVVQTSQTAQRTRRRMVRRCGAALVIALAATGCSGNDKPVALPSIPTPTPSATPTPAPPPPPKPAKPVNPLTGIGAPPGGPVIAVKVDNVADARPQVGLNAADVIYIEQAEGGLTRLVAVFATHKPRTVAPVRSVRNSDPELLAQYGKIVLAFSGGAGGPLATFRRSSLTDGSADVRGAEYRRLGSKPAPHNLAVDLFGLSHALPHAGGSKDVGFDWAARDARLFRSRSVHTFTLTMGSTPLNFTYNADLHGYLNGAGGVPYRDSAGKPLAKPNVVIQFCPTTVDHSDVDAAGNPAAYTHTIGHGRAILFRDGRIIDGSWRRNTLKSPTRFYDKGGKELLLRPGGTWVVLAPTGSPLRLN
jgi:Protein of unknown function (DUF3048) N-terminal domain/Protein of unknown function (DUF3048) C-terminal domain